MLIKNATALERLAEIDTVVFDKTGTLTQGAPRVTNLDEFPDSTLSVALALAQNSGHPLSIALAEAIRDKGIRPARIDDLHEVPGQGVEARLKRETLRLGRADWIGARPGPYTATYLKIGKLPPLVFHFADTLRDGAAQAVADLKAQGKTVLLLSGDTPAAVADIATRTGIGIFEAGVLPDEKAARISDLTAKGHRVLMVGDGLNDTAALAAAHVSISPASALEATRVVSDIVLLGNSLVPLGDAVKTARSATRRIRENFAIAAGYNAIAIPIALIGLATPLAAALAMSASSITVSLNALRLR